MDVGGDRRQTDLDSALADRSGRSASADEMCQACVDLLEVDGAAVSWFQHGVSRGTFAASSELSRSLDELQFTLGEGPCVDAVSQGCPVLVPDLAATATHRWPAYSRAVLASGVRAVFALPVSVPTGPVAALDLFRRAPGPLSDERLIRGLRAAELVVRPLFDQVGVAAGWDAAERQAALGTVERVEVYQATGMIMAQLDVGPEEALVRLRAHAFAHDMSASDVAWAVVERRLVLGPCSEDGTP